MSVAAATLPVPQKAHRHHIWLTAGGVLVAFIVLLNILAALGQSANKCVHSCRIPPPPVSSPAAASSRFHSSGLGFTLSYDKSVTGSPSNQTGSSVAWQWPLKSGGYFDAQFQGSRARGTSPLQLVNALHGRSFSQFQPIYPVAGAEIGYVLGAGEVYEGQWTPLQGQSQTERMVIMAAIKGGVGVTLVCEGPKTADNGSHPNPAQIGVGADQWCDQTLNTVTWPGEKPL
ncbi:MAG TPA: hypothetical protein VFB34_04670 [Chloroflexota bacterium]|nr:hypothetical protein [Chloroflexota bacterium]